MSFLLFAASSRNTLNYLEIRKNELLPLQFFAHLPRKTIASGSAMNLAGYHETEAVLIAHPTTFNQVVFVMSKPAHVEHCEGDTP